MDADGNPEITRAGTHVLGADETCRDARADRATSSVDAVKDTFGAVVDPDRVRVDASRIGLIVQRRFVDDGVPRRVDSVEGLFAVADDPHRVKRKDDAWST